MQSETGGFSSGNINFPNSQLRHVVAAEMKMAGHLQIDKQSLFNVLTAAWLHDTGALYGQWIKHELKRVTATEIF